MKPYLHLLAAAAVACTAQGQDPNAPKPSQPPGTPPPGEHQPPGPPREPRFPAPERGPDQRRPDNQRGPQEQRPQNDRRENAGPRGPQREGGPGGERREGVKPDGREGNREGGRGPNFGGPGHPPMMSGMAPQPTPFLGVMTMALPEPLNAQLKIPVGFGLIVGEVLPGSPAAQAGIKKFDVLKLLNDQQLSEPGQLQALVRAAGKDKEVTLTLVREAQEQKVTVKIGERMAPPRGAGAGPGAMGHHFGEEAWQRAREMQERARALGGEAGERAREMQERARAMGGEAAERAREFQEKARRYREQNGPRPPGRPDGDRPDGDRPKPGAALSPEGESNVQVTVNTSEAKSRLRFSDNDVEIEVAGEDGHRTLKARSRDGQPIFEGLIDTPEQREAIPQPIKEKLERIRLRPGAPGAEMAAFSGAQADGPPAELDVQ